MTMEIPTPVCGLVRNDTLIDLRPAVRGRSRIAEASYCVGHINDHLLQKRHRAGQGRNDYANLTHDLSAGTAGKRSFTRKSLPLRNRYKRRK